MATPTPPLPFSLTPLSPPPPPHRPLNMSVLLIIALDPVLALGL